MDTRCYHEQINKKVKKILKAAKRAAEKEALQIVRELIDFALEKLD